MKDNTEPNRTYYKVRFRKSGKSSSGWDLRIEEVLKGNHI